MGHVTHLLEYLFETTKIGGWIAAICVIGAFLLMMNAHPFMVDAQGCSKEAVTCAKEFKTETLVSDLGGALAGGIIGIGIALLLVSLGVSKDTLGIDE